MDSFQHDKQFYTDVMNLIFNEYSDIIRFQCEIQQESGRFIDGIRYTQQADLLYQNTHTNIYSGVSKCVLVNQDLHYVCKFPRVPINDCQREYELFTQSIVEHVDRYFAPCAPIGSCHNLPLYLMERMELPQEDEVLSCFSDEYSSNVSLNQNEKTVWEYFCQSWGSNCNDLYDFMKKYKINDLHDENIGFDQNDVLKLIDYSGFHGFAYNLHLPNMASLINFKE